MHRSASGPSLTLKRALQTSSPTVATIPAPPTIVLIYGDIKTSDSLSPLVSLPTMLVAFATTAATAASPCWAQTSGSCWHGAD